MTVSRSETVVLRGSAIGRPMLERQEGQRLYLPLWAWWLIAVATAATLALLAKGYGRAFEFLDSDDALRFIHLRELIAGAPWFEIKTHALGGADGLVSHWSRLIDGPMAAMLSLFGLVLPATAAQRLLVTVWPVAMLAAVLWAITRCTLSAYGREAAHFALALGTLALLAYYQFVPGRLDHHNVMIAATVSAALIIWAWPQSAEMWRWAGALCGLALSIGYEALAPTFAISTLAAGWGLIDRRQATQSSAFTIGLVGALMLALILTVAPARWLDDPLRRALAQPRGAGGTGRRRFRGGHAVRRGVVVAEKDRSACRFLRRWPRSIRHAGAHLPRRADGPGTASARPDLDGPRR